MNNTRGNTGPSGEINASSLPENRTLYDVFDRAKVAALKNALKLGELIPDIRLNGCFGDVEATDENRPMQALRLAGLLRHQLLSLECIKIILANEKRQRD